MQRNGLTSITFDILERAEPPEHPCKTDEEALLYHYKDVTETGHVREGTEAEESSTIWERDQITVTSVGPDPSAYSLFATQTPTHASFQGTDPNTNKPIIDFTAILFSMIRLEQQKTDLVIAIYVPHAQGEYNANELDYRAKRYGPLVTAAKTYYAKIQASFEIHDWNLFVVD